MSEHDEPKTALTTSRPNPSDLPEGTPVLAWPGSRDSSPLLTRTRTPVFQTRSGDLLVSVDGHPGGIALTHIEVMPEGYTTSPAPEAIRIATPETWAAKQGVRIVDPDGWRGTNGRGFSDPITAEEFARRVAVSTVVPVGQATDEHEEDS